MDLEYGDDNFRLMLACDGFEAAFHRWEAAKFPANTMAAFAPLTECLWWAVSIDERMHEVEGESYRDRRDRDTDGRLMLGVIWARNRAGHQHAVMTQRQEGTTVGDWVLGVGRLGVETSLLWDDASVIPAGTSDRGRDVYETRMRGRPVYGTIEALRRWINGTMRMAGPLDFGPRWHSDA